jgi:hypothetical protein
MTEIKLGLCNPPEPIYLYVGNGELSGESYLWYHYDIDKEKTIPVSQRGITGYISELRLTTKEFKGKDNIKLDIVMSAGEIYIVRTGIETNFAKTFLLSASLIQSFDKPLIVAANAGKENVVFCNLYDAATKARIHKEWDTNADWAAIIKTIQSRLGSSSESVAIYDSPSPPTAHNDVNASNTVIGEAQIKRLWAIARNELKLNDEIIKNVILGFGYQSSKEIAANKYDAVIQKLHNESVVAF